MHLHNPNRKSKYNLHTYITHWHNTPHTYKQLTRANTLTLTAQELTHHTSTHSTHTANTRSVCTYACVCVTVCAYVSARARVCLCVRVHVSVRARVCLYMLCVYIYVCIYVLPCECVWLWSVSLSLCVCSVCACVCVCCVRVVFWCSIQYNMINVTPKIINISTSCIYITLTVNLNTTYRQHQFS